MASSEGPIVLAHEAAIALGPLRIEPGVRRVSRAGGGDEILQPRIMQVLVALARTPGQILTRDELTTQCWNGVVVGEDAINRAIGQLRRLSEGLGSGAFKVETINKVGYRILPGEAADTPAATPAARPSPDRPSICVLPFANMSGDPDQGYFSDGVSEDIITDLSRVSALSVVARNRAFTFRGASVDARQIAAQLGVSHVLEGSVRQAAGRVRISAQLIDGAAGDHVWAERWDRDLADIFAVQDEISQAIVAALKLRLLPAEKEAIARRGTDSPDAYNLYLQARQHYVSGNQGERARDEAIIRLARRATEIDPGYARAWALLGLGQSWLDHIHGEGDGGFAAAERALALDASLADGHTVRAKYLGDRGQADAAFAEIARALALEPDSYEANETAALLNFHAGRMGEAIRFYERASALMEQDFGSPGMLIGIYAAVGDPESARRSARTAQARCEKTLARDPSNGGAMGFLVAALAALGQRAEALDWIGRALKIDPDNRNMRYNFACSLAMLGDIDGAIDLLGPFFATVPEGFLQHSLTDPDLASVRADPRFDALADGARRRLAASTGAAIPETGDSG